MRAFRGTGVGLLLGVAISASPAQADIPDASTLSPANSSDSAVAIDDAGQANVGWATTDQSSHKKLHFCRVAPGGTTCASDTLAPIADGGYRPRPLLEDASDGKEVRMWAETAATDPTYAGKSVIVPSSDGGATYGTPRVTGGGNLILPDVVTAGPGAFSWSALAFNEFLSGPLEGTSATQPITLAPGGGNDLEEPMGIGFPDPTTPLTVWYHVHYPGDGSTVKTISYRHWLGTGSVNDVAQWGPLKEFSPTDGMFSAQSTDIASGPKGVFALYTPQQPGPGACGRRPEVLRYDPVGDTWSAPMAVDADPHTDLPTCNYDDGTDGSPFQIVEDGQGVLHVIYAFGSGKPFADQSVPQGILYTVSFDGGATWQRPISLGQVDQITYDGHWRMAVNLSGDGILTWENSQASSGPVVQMRRLPPLSAFTAAPPPSGGGGTTTTGGTTPPPSGPCQALITVGAAKLLARQGCWTKTGTTYKATGAVRISGIDLLPPGGARRGARAAAVPSISVDTAKQVITEVGDYRAKIGSVDLGTPKVDWRIPAGGGQVLDAVTGDPVGMTIAKGQTLLGLPVGGVVTPSLDGGLAKLPMNLELPEPLQGIAGALTDDITFTADVTRGLHLDLGSVNIDLPEVDLGVAKLAPFHVKYDADPFVFEADLGLSLPGGFGELDGHLGIGNGQLIDLAADYTPPSPGILVATEVYLTKVGFHLHKGQTCSAQDQSSLGISADLSGGGQVGGVSLVEIDGSAIYKLGASTATCSLPAVFRIDGDGKIVGLTVAHVFFQYTTPAILEFGADLTLGSHATVGLDAGIHGGINASNLHFYIEGKADVYVLHYNPASVDVIGSNIGLGACAKLDLLPGANLLGLDTTIKAGGYVLWSDGKLRVMGSGCNVSFLKPKDFARAHAAQAGAPQTFTVAKGTPSQTFLAFGRTKAPAFALRAPDGTTYTTPTADQQQNRSGPAKGLTLDGNQQASITVDHPAPGTWTLTPQGDEPITEVQTAAGVTLPTVRGHVRHIRGRRFALDWTATGGSPGVAIDVAEQSGKGGTRGLGTLHGSRGSLRFVAAPGPGGSRAILAAAHGDGAPPTAAHAIAHYVAPPPRPPHAPRHVSTLRSRTAVRVSWRASAGAARYVVRATLRDGRRQEIPVSATRRSAVLADVPGPDAGAVRVYPVGADGRIGKPGTARLKAVHHRRKKKHKAPRA